VSAICGGGCLDHAGGGVRHTNAATIMIAEKAADLMRDQVRLAA
jgi:hypothetical protein